MKVSVKTLKGTHFQIDVKPGDIIADVKKTIEASQGDIYPASQQMLIHRGKVMDDNTTLEEHKVSDDSFIVIMLSKIKVSTSGTSATSAAPSSVVQPTTAAPQVTLPVTTAPQTTAPQTSAVASAVASLETAPESSVPVPASDSSGTDVYGQAASNLVAGSTFESSLQRIIDIGGGSWTRDTVARALHAAYNNPERAIEYLYSGIPEAADVAPTAQAPSSAEAVNPPNQAPQAAVPTGGPNANPLDLFPQGLPSVGTNPSVRSLDFLRNSQQFHALRAMVQANPQILQPMLQELGKQNPNLMRLIQEHQADFLRLMNEPVEGEEGNILGQLVDAMPQPITVTPEEREAIERLESMGFDRALVLEVYFACNKDEELAANYLLDHIHEFDD